MGVPKTMWLTGTGANLDPEIRIAGRPYAIFKGARPTVLIKYKFRNLVQFLLDLANMLPDLAQFLLDPTTFLLDPA